MMDGNVYCKPERNLQSNVMSLFMSCNWNLCVCVFVIFEMQTNRILLCPRKWSANLVYHVMYGNTSILKR